MGCVVGITVIVGLLFDRNNGERNVVDRSPNL